QVDPRRARVRFSFRPLNPKGVYSRKAFGELPNPRRKAIRQAFLRYSQMTLIQFKSSNGVQLRTQNLSKKRYKRPEALSEDVKDQLWQHFRLSGRGPRLWLPPRLNLLRGHDRPRPRDQSEPLTLAIGARGPTCTPRNRSGIVDLW